MSDILTISKQHPAFPAYLDFQVLRAIGIRHLQALSSDLWTDYNLHDPGVTILEVLCYAITDLGYRNNLDIKDLLALNLADPTQKETNFFTADHILTCNPVTLLDLRKRLIDIPGVRNAWIEKTETYTPTLYVNPTEGRLQYTLPPRQTQTTALKLNPRGLYTVLLDLEPPLQKDACGNAYRSWGDTLAMVKSVLCAYRNLCEDIHDMVVLGEEEIALCADIELTAGADPETVLVDIYVRVQAFLAPRLRFYTLQEMLALGKSPAEIFAGRPSVSDDDEYPSHGFIDTAELEALQLPRALYTSDLYAILMDVPGVAAIKKFSLINYINGLPQSTGHPWHLILTEKHRPVLSPERSRITFFKGDLPFRADSNETLRRYREQQAAYIKVAQDSQELDLAVPQGSYYDLAEYYSIHHEFPQTYGISEDGLPATATALRKAQARQLKGYLVFFDQILANYLAQLSHIRDLFSWEQGSAEDDSNQPRTYFTARLTNIPKGEEILRNLSPASSSDRSDEPPTDYATFLNAISEDTDTYGERRNRFLDHLLARFAETFSDYVLLNYQMGRGRRDETHIIHDKAQFLRDYSELSRDRFRAFNYCDCEAVWDTDNVSGFQKRVARLLGIADIRRRTLGHYRVNLNTDITLRLSQDNTQVLLVGERSYPTLEAAEGAIATLLTRAFDPNSYRRLAYRFFFHYGWQVNHPTTGNGVLRYELFFPTQAEQQAVLAPLLDTLRARLAGLMPPVDSETSDADEDLEPGPSVMDYITLMHEPDGRVSFRLVIPPGEAGEGAIAFTSIQSYNTPEAAQDDALASLQWIQDGDRYQPFRLYQDDTSDPSTGTAETFTYYGYGLLGDDGHLLATTPQRFDTPEARDVALQRWLTGLLSNRASFSVAPATECFVFEVRDRSGQLPLLRGRVGLPTATAAEANLAQALEQGKSRDAYTLTDEAETFGFFLQGEFLPGEAGTAFALHPPTYATEPERHLRLDALLYYLNRWEPVATINGETGTFQAILLDRDGNPLLITYHSYPTQTLAEAAYQRLLHLASDPVYFQILNDLAGEHPYGFSLVDRRGRTFATHPVTYPTACQRDWAIRSIVNYINVDVTMRLVTREAQVFYELVDPAMEPLLISAVGYATEVEATAAFNRMVALAQEGDRYRLIDDSEGDRPYGFGLMEGTTQVAQHPIQYASAAERDQALQAVINQVIDADPDYRVEGVEGQFTHALMDVLAADTDAPPLLMSVVTYPDEESARNGFHQMVAIAAQVERYTLIDTLPAPAPYGFELRDESGERLAAHQAVDGTPIGYETIAERAAAIAKIIAYVTRAEIQSAILNVEGAFFAELRDEDGHLIWIGQQTFPDTATAAAAAQQIQELAQRGDRYQPINTGVGACAYSFILTDDTDTPIAIHPTYYPTAESRDAQMVQLQLSMAGTPAFTVNTPGTCCGYSYALDVSELGAIAPLRSLERYATEARAWQAASHLANQLHRLSRYVTAEDSPDRPWRFAITDDQGTALAATPTALEPLAVFQLLNDVEPLLHWEAIDGDAIDGDAVDEDAVDEDAVDEEILGYRFQLRDRSGTPLLQGTQIFSDEASVRDHFYRDILGRLWEPSTVELTESLLGFGFQVRGIASEPEGEAPMLAFHPRPDQLSEVRLYGTARERDGAIARLLQTIRTVRLTATATPHIPAYTGQIVDDANQVLLQGTRRHSYEWAILGTPQGGDVSPTWIAEGETWQQQIAMLTDDVTQDRLTAEAIFAGENGLGRALYRFQVMSDTTPWLVGSERFLTQEEAMQRGREAIALLQSTIAEADNGLDPLASDPHAPLMLRVRYHQGRERSLVLLDQSARAEAEKLACDHGNVLVELAQNSANIRTIDDDQGTCTFTWELTNEGKDTVLGVPLHDYASPEARQTAIQTLQHWLNDEGFHVIEHILLRPRHSPSEPVCAFDPDEPPLDGIDPQRAIPVPSACAEAATEPESGASEPRDNYDLTRPSQTGQPGFERFFVQEQERYVFHYNDCRGNPLFYSEAYRNEADRDSGLRSVIQNSIRTEHYRQYQIGVGDRTLYFFTLRAENNQEIGRSRYFDALWKLEACLDWFQHQVHRSATDEGIDLEVPATLQTPEFVADDLLPVAQNLDSSPGMTPCLATYDPYSFWISVILPYWPERFQDMNFRRWVERTLRLEAPAHVALKICWIDLCQMHQFETAYQDWLEQFSLDACQQAACHLPQSLNRLIDRLTHLKNVYPQGTLHDCEESGPDDNPILLDQTALGTANP